MPPHGRRVIGLYEPIHGSAPDIAGQGKVNPVGMLLSVAAMLRTSLRLPEEAAATENAVRAVIESGTRTADIRADEQESVSTPAMGDAIAARVRA